MQSRTVVIIGQGYVGLPLAQAAVQAGHTVIGFDANPRKAADIREGRSPIEDVTDADLASMLATDAYHCLGDASELQGVRFDVAIVTVPTPLTDGQPDLGAVEAAGGVIGMMLRTAPEGIGVPLVVLESTVAPGTTRGAFTAAIEKQANRRRPVGVFHTAFSPERIDPGNAVYTFRTTPKLVGGTTELAGQLARAFYETICDTVHLVSSAEVAEAAKLAENTYRQVNIALANEQARHLRAMGIDPWEVIAAARTKPYGYTAFYPGPGVGGHCIPIDPQYLANAVELATGAGFDFVRLAMQINRAQPGYVVQRVMAGLNDLGRAVRGSTILVVGAAYKRNTGDLRESPSEEIVRQLAGLGAEVHVYDPCADPAALNAFALHCSESGFRNGYPLDDAGYVFAVSETEHLQKILAERRRMFTMALVLTDHTGVPWDEILRAVPWVLDTRGTLSKASNVTAL